MTERPDARVTVNCAGLYADEVARLFGDDSFEIYPRKGEFFVFDGIALDRILLPAPTTRTKGVLVFPTLDGKVVAGPTARRPGRQGGLVGAAGGARRGAREGGRAAAGVADAEPIGSWAGLRPAGRGVTT